MIEASTLALFPPGILFAGHAGVHVAHHLIETLQAGRREVKAGIANCALFLRTLAPRLAGGADIHAASAKTALL